MYPMNINCNICHSNLKIQNGYAKMTCLCYEDDRILTLNQINHGFYNDIVYLLDNNQKKGNIYEENEEGKKYFCNV